MEVIEISPCSSKEKEEEGTPVRPILCLKRNMEMELKRFEEMEDCFILDFDPFESVDISKLSMSNNLPDDDNDLFVTAEKGQVACRDYPHSRHLCLKFPFDSTPRESYCDLCYCYVCDLAAPCKFWREPDPESETRLSHCHASEHDGDWKSLRILKKRKSAGQKLE